MTTGQFSFMSEPLPLEAVLSRYEYKSIRDAASRLRERLKSKETDAVLTASRSLVETTCKTLLDLLTIEYAPATDAIALSSKLLNALDLHPSVQTSRALKRTAQGALNMVEGLAFVRNKHSDAHGVGQETVALDYWHAEFCAYQACAVTNYFVQAYEAKVTRRRRAELSTQDQSILIGAWREVAEKHKITNPDNLPYSDALEEIAKAFTRKTGVVLARRDIFLSLVGLRKASRLPKSSRAK